MSDGRRERLRVHLTLLDVSDATIARDLCIFMLLDELNKTTDTTERMEIKATLMYAFSAPVMPPYCAQRWAPWFPTIYIDHSLSSQVEEFIRRHLQTPHYQSSRAPPMDTRSSRISSRTSQSTGLLVDDPEVHTPYTRHPRDPPTLRPTPTHLQAGRTAAPPRDSGTQHG